MLIAGAAMLLTASALQAAGISATVLDGEGEPVEDAVVTLVPAAAADRIHTPGSTAVMDQRDKQFIPYVLPVQAGTRVLFPNGDNIKHHVYSFSPAKRFELKLYAAGSAAPIVFDKAGVVALGCNIHDWMLAYVYVVDTPWFAKTDGKGVLAITDVPPGEYRASVWHPRLRGDAARHDQTVTLAPSAPARLEFGIGLKREWRRRAPHDHGSY